MRKQPQSIYKGKLHFDKTDIEKPKYQFPKGPKDINDVFIRTKPFMSIDG